MKATLLDGLPRGSRGAGDTNTASRKTMRNGLEATVRGVRASSKGKSSAASGANEGHEEGWSAFNADRVAYLGQFRYTSQNIAGDEKCQADVFYRWFSEPFWKSKCLHTFITPVELFDRDTGDLPRKDPIGECQWKAMSTASSPSITRAKLQLERYVSRRIRKDGPSWISDNNTETERRLLNSAHLN